MNKRFSFWGIYLLVLLHAPSIMAINEAMMTFDEQVVNGTTGVPLGGFGCGGVKFDANAGRFAVMTTPPADAYDFQERPGSSLSLSVSRSQGAKIEETLKAARIGGRPDDDAFWPLHKVNFGAVGGIQARMTSYSPFDNDDYDNMHLPYALYEVTLTNTQRDQAEAEFVFHWNLQTDSMASWALVAECKGRKASTVSNQQQVAVKTLLKGGQTVIIRYVLAWYNHTDPELGYYMNRYQDPQPIAKHGLKVFDRLKHNAETLASRMRASSLPGWLKNMTQNTLASVVINAMYKKDGRTAFAEGQWTCNGTMDQMWVARKIINELLPRYAWQEADYWARTQMQNGQIHHDFNLDNRGRDKARRSRLVAWDDTEHADYRNIQKWVDLNAGFIISVYEIYKATADREHFLRLWPNMKRAAQRMLDQVEQYGSKDYPYTFLGSENSYDHGGNPDPYNASLSAVAYLIMEQLASEQGEDDVRQAFANALQQVRTSYHNRYVTARHPITGMHCESVFAGQWLAFHLQLGEIWPKEDTDFILAALDDYYKPLQQGLGFPKGTYDEWTPYILTHYGGLHLLAGNDSIWLSLQKDAYMRQYMDRDRVFDHKLDVLPVRDKPKWMATNLKSKGQYISIPAVWRNYYDIVGFHRDRRTHELWITPAISQDMTDAMFVCPEGYGTLSAKFTPESREFTVNTEHPMQVSTLYVADDFEGDPIVTINGKNCDYQRVGTGYARRLAIKWNGEIGKKGLQVQIVKK